jgi:hypothetical protein
MKIPSTFTKQKITFIDSEGDFQFMMVTQDVLE